MKTLVIAISLSLGMSSAMAATNQGELKKELEIMSSVMETAIKQSDRRSSIRIRSTDATYLANQGVVFTFSTSGHGRELFINLEGIEDLVGAALAPQAPLPPNVIFSSNDGFHFEHHWDEAAEEALEHFRDTLEDTADKLRDLRSRERDVSWEDRELARRLRDLEFQLRNVTDDQKAEVQERLEEVQKKQAKLKERKEQIKAYVVQVETEQKKQVEDQLAAREQITNQFLSDFESQVGDILCRFGSGLRALDENENVTFVLKGVKPIGKERLDRIYVFSKKDINRCVQAKIDQNALLSAAVVYEF